MITRPLLEPELVDIEAARTLFKERGADVRRTPLIRSHYLSERLGCNVYLKLENLQRTGSYKIRGAFNCIAHLDKTEKIVAASAGNHAQGVAYATAFLDRPQAVICMPFDAPKPKIQKTESFDDSPADTPADQRRIVIDLSSANYDDAKKTAERYVARGYKNVRAFDDPYVIAGQGTVALEIIDQLPEIDVIVAPVGGGGLLSGIAIAMNALKPDVQIYGVESSTAAPFIAAYDQNGGKITDLGKATTIADGIKVAKAGETTWQIIDRLLGRQRLLDVPDRLIAAAMQTLSEHETLLVEGAGAIALAALVHSDTIERSGGKPLIQKPRGTDTNVVLVISGGNIDPDMFRRLLDVTSGRESRIAEYRIEAPPNVMDWVTIMTVLKRSSGMLRAVSEAANVVAPSDGAGCVRFVELVVEFADRDKHALFEAEMMSAGIPVMPRMPVTVASEKRTRWSFRVQISNNSDAMADFVTQFTSGANARLTINPLLWYPGAISDGAYQEFFDVTAELDAPCSAEEFVKRGAMLGHKWRIEAWW